MEKGQLLFTLSQNSEGEFPELEPYEVIEYMGLVENLKPPFKGFSGCDEHGFCEWLPSDRMLFRPANEETELAFLGETVVDNGVKFLVVTRIRE